MGITSAGLQQLGFKSLNIHPEDGDFNLRQETGGVVFISEWVSESPQPTEAEIEAAHTVWKAEYDSQEYARKRLAEYPSIDELTVALWEGVVEERMAAVTQLEIKRQAVKAKHPK
jgi:hypothetical protein